MKKTYEDRAKVFKAFCDEKRLTIIDMLTSGEKCACSILDNMDITQSTLSHHMKILCESSIVKSRKDGKWTHYSISHEGSEYAKHLIDEITKVTGTDSCS